MLLPSGRAISLDGLRADRRSRHRAARSRDRPTCRRWPCRAGPSWPTLGRRRPAAAPPPRRCGACPRSRAPPVPVPASPGRGYGAQHAACRRPTAGMPAHRRRCWRAPRSVAQRGQVGDASPLPRTPADRKPLRGLPDAAPEHFGRNFLRRVMVWPGRRRRKNHQRTCSCDTRIMLCRLRAQPRILYNPTS